MITVRQVVETELEARAELAYLLHENLININGLARNLRPIVQKQLGETVGIDTISMAIRRSQKKQIAKAKTLHLPKVKNIQVQLDVAVLTYHKDAPVQAIADSSKYRFFSFANGRNESMLAISQEDAAQFKNDSNLYQTNMAAMTVTLEEESLDTVGAYAYIQTTLSLAGIPIAEVLSVHDDLTLLLKDEHIDRAFQVLRLALKQGQR